jgi:hypothetical protein
MNNTMKKFIEFLESKNFKCRTATDNENVGWFQLKLPKIEATPLFFVSYTESTGVLIIMASHMAKLNSVGIDLMRQVNAFNADPANFSCKMFIDPEGEIVVNNSTFITAEDPQQKILENMDLTVDALCRHYESVINVINDSSNS